MNFSPQAGHRDITPLSVRESYVQAWQTLNVLLVVSYVSLSPNSCLDATSHERFCVANPTRELSKLKRANTSHIINVIKQCVHCCL